MNFFAISGLINGIAATIFGLFGYLINRRALIHKIFGLMNGAVAIWSYGYFLWLISEQEQTALFWTRVLAFGATLIPILFLHWILLLLGTEKEKKPSLIIGYVATFILVIFSFSPLYVAKVEPTLFFKFWPKPGFLYHFYIVFIYLGLLGYGCYQLLLSYKKTSGILKQQIKFVLFGISIGLIGGFTNFPLWYGINLPPYGNILITFYVVIFAYAMLKHHLMDIKVIATEIFTLAISLILLVNSLYSNSFNALILNFSILLAVILFGILLIRSVLKEVRSKEELAKLTVELQAAYKDLQALDKSKSEFLSMASHQLRTPLSAIKGYISMLIDGSYGKISKRAEDKLKNVFQSNERLIRLVNDLLDISKIEMGKMELDKMPTQIEDMIQSCCDEMKIGAEEKNLSFVFKKPENPLPKVLIDVLKVRQVILNLIDNAIRYTPKGKIEVKAEKVGAVIRISVKDTGEGLSNEEKNNIFERFSRGSAGLTLFIEGTGLGLYTAKKFLEVHKSRIWAESEGKGKGSTFIVELPIE